MDMFLKKYETPEVTLVEMAVEICNVNATSTIRTGEEGEWQ